MEIQINEVPTPAETYVYQTMTCMVELKNRLPEKYHELVDMAHTLMDTAILMVELQESEVENG